MKRVVSLKRMCEESCIVAGDVVNQRFSLYCSDWQDDGFADPTNATDGEEEDTDVDDSSKALYYKFLLHKNGVTVPIAESGMLAIDNMCYC